MKAETVDYLAAQWQRIHKTTAVLPYLLLTRGPVVDPCPMHGQNEGLLLAADHPYWQQALLRGVPGCACRVRQVGRSEYKKLVADGVPIATGMERSECGQSTGRPIFEKKPALTTPR